LKIEGLGAKLPSHFEFSGHFLKIQTLKQDILETTPYYQQICIKTNPIKAARWRFSRISGQKKINPMPF
jgi:hypothetical protein